MDSPDQDHLMVSRFRLFIIFLLCPLAPLSSQASRDVRWHELQRIAAGTEDLSLVGLVALTPGKTIWITQPQDGVILGFSPRTGNRITTVGRRGAGPGEFRAVRSLVAVGDSLAVYDPDLRRLTWFGTDGRLKSTHRIDRPAQLDPRAREFSAGPASIFYQRVGQAYRVGENGSIGPRGEIHVYAARLDGTGLRRLATTGFLPCSLFKPIGTGGTEIAIPFCHSVEVVASPDGGRVAVLTPVSGNADTTAVHALITTSDGDTLLNRQYLVGRSPIPASVMEERLARWRKASSTSREDMYDELSDRGLLPRTYPPVRSAFLADDGVLWVTANVGTTRSPELIVIGVDGHELGRGPLPNGNTRIGWAGGTLALAIEEQEDGLEDVVLYSVTP